MFKVGDQVRIVSGDFQGGYGTITNLLDDGTHCNIQVSAETTYSYVALSDLELDQ